MYAAHACIGLHFVCRSHGYQLDVSKDQPRARDSKRAHHAASTHDTIAQQLSPCRDATNVPRYLEPATHSHEQRCAQHPAAPAHNGGPNRQVYVSHSTVPVSKLLAKGGTAQSQEPATGVCVLQGSRAAALRHPPQHAAASRTEPQQPAAVTAGLGEAGRSLRPRTGLRLTQMPEVTGQPVKRALSGGVQAGQSGWDMVAMQAEIPLDYRR